MDLYKFLTAEGASAVLENQSLKFTPLREYNDPFEGDNVFEFSLDPETGNVVVNGEEGRRCTLAHGPDLDAVVQAREFIATHSACCFCQRNDSVLLWSHYAEQHRGICLQFDFGQLNDGVSDIVRLPDRRYLLFCEVNYSTQRPVLLVNTDEASVVPYELVDKSLFTKASDWAYERECRFVMRNAPKTTYIQFAANRLKRVVFGMRCKSDDEKAISTIAISKYPHVVLAKAQKHQFKYAVEIADLCKGSK